MQRNQLPSALHSVLSEERRNMVPRRVITDPQPLSDVLVGLPLQDQLQDFQLSRRGSIQSFSLAFLF
jgi:hypothetical protein